MITIQIHEHFDDLFGQEHRHYNYRIKGVKYISKSHYSWDNSCGNQTDLKNLLMDLKKDIEKKLILER